MLKRGSRLLLLLWLVAASLPAAAQTLAPLGTRLAREVDEPFPEDGLRIRVKLRASDLPSAASARTTALRSRQDRVLAALPTDGFTLTRRYGSLAGFSGRIEPAALSALRRHPDVVSVHLDGRVFASTLEGIPLIGADEVRDLGFSGLGVNVAVLDSGIDTDHPHLQDDIVAEKCFCGPPPCCPGGGSESSSAEDDNGHGTSVSGIITSAATASRKGVAPDAGIVAVKVLNSQGVGADSDVDAGLDWVLLNRITYDISIVNLSLGDKTEHGNPNSAACSSTPTADAVEALHSAGVVVFAASGNEGFDSGIAAPACNPDAISVGGVYDAALGSVSWCGTTCGTILCTDTGTAPDDFVCHSNSHAILDLLAPDWKTRIADLGGSVANFGGTSAASPYAAAQAALLLEADPTLTPTEIRTLLTSHGPMVTNPDNGLSFRRSDVELAMLTLFECGDGVLDPNEECDDGGTVGGDCCSATCEFESAGSSCNDGDLCTDTDVCDGSGTCGGSAITCDDFNGCTDDSCNPGSGCVFTNNSDPCDDGDACTTADTCSGGACAGGLPLTCDDVNPCTDDSCNPGSGCVFTNNTDPCDDGDVCTTVDVCASGSCLGGSPLVCDDSNACTDDSCNSGSGCVFTNNTAPCDDGDACSDPDACSGGACAGGPPFDCDDGDSCTADGCDGLTGCFHTPIEPCFPVPTSGSWARLLITSMLLAAGALLALRRR